VEFAVDYGSSFGCGYHLVDMLAVLPLAIVCGENPYLSVCFARRGTGHSTNADAQGSGARSSTR
jgi:hypothetical protein